MVVRQDDAQPGFSTVLCTCDGEQFLEAQVVSVIDQTCPPDELVVCDDASEDGTTRLLGNLTAKAPFPINVYKNDHRVGVRENFEQAIRFASGDVISLCDQDDVWLPGKLEVFKRAFEEGADWVCCDAEVVDAELTPLGYTLWQQTNFNEREKRRARHGNFFEVLLKHYVVAGATIAFRSELREKLLPIPKNWHYDAWLASVLAATSKGVIIETPLQRYRQHDTNAIGGMRRGLLAETRTVFSLDRDVFYEDEIARWSQLAERLKSLDTPIQYKTQLADKIAHLMRRAEWPRSRVM